jgi:hypothetical protein
MMRKLQMLMVAAIVAMATSAAVAQVKGMGRLNGKVADEGGTPVDGVSVKLRQGTDVIEATTDAKGQWVLAGVARGNWMVSFEKDGFPTKVVKVLVEKELMRTEPIKITLKKSA